METLLPGVSLPDPVPGLLMTPGHLACCLAAVKRGHGSLRALLRDGDEPCRAQTPLFPLQWFPELFVFGFSSSQIFV